MWDSIVLDTLRDAGLELARARNSIFLRLIQHDDQVVVTYEMTKPNGEKGRNTETLRVEDNKIISVEVYFGWDVLADHLMQ